MKENEHYYIVAGYMGATTGIHLYYRAPSFCSPPIISTLKSKPKSVLWASSCNRSFPARLIPCNKTLHPAKIRDIYFKIMVNHHWAYWTSGVGGFGSSSRGLVDGEAQKAWSHYDSFKDLAFCVPKLGNVRTPFYPPQALKPLDPKPKPVRP